MRVRRSVLDPRRARSQILSCTTYQERSTDCLTLHSTLDLVTKSMKVGLDEDHLPSALRIPAVAVARLEPGRVLRRSPAPAPAIESLLTPRRAPGSWGTRPSWNASSEPSRPTHRRCGRSPSCSAEPERRREPWRLPRPRIGRTGPTWQGGTGTPRWEAAAAETNATAAWRTIVRTTPAAAGTGARTRSATRGRSGSLGGAFPPPRPAPSR
jgi:hypothetical protein